MIHVEGLTKRYGQTTVVDGVSFDVARGELFVLVGGSGSGKTTTLKMINRLIEPTSGRVFIDGRDAAGRPGHLLRREIGYVFQRVGLFPRMTLAQNVAVTLELLGWSSQATRARVEELLGLVELGGIDQDRLPKSLSGGQAQRVGIARALAARPKILLLDEPFAALDPITRERLQSSFQRIRRETGVTSLFVTHDLVEAFLLADRIGVLDEGHLVQVGTPRELVDAPADDYVRELMETPRRHAHLLGAFTRGVGIA